jgi:hypothetical protein
MPPIDVTRVSFGWTSILGYLGAGGSALAEIVKAIEGAHVTTADPLALAAIILGSTVTAIRGLQAAAKAHGK